jgi:hypothetical protein
MPACPDRALHRRPLAGFLTDGSTHQPFWPIDHRGHQ